MKNALLAICFFLIAVAAMAADAVKGMIQDASTKKPLQGASVRLVKSSPLCTAEAGKQ